MDHAGPGDEPPSAYQSFLFTAGSAEEAAYFAALRERFGDEVADRVQRTRAMRGRSRPLTDRERSRLREAMAPVLRDIQVSGAIPPAIQEETHDAVDDEWIGVMLWSSDGTGMGVFIPAEPIAAEQVARLAEQVQEWEIEELASVGRSATWPECPEHPNSHPLQPAADDSNRAVWRCPRSGRVISQVGALGRKG